MIPGIIKTDRWNYTSTQDFHYAFYKPQLADADYDCLSQGKKIGLIQVVSGVVNITVFAGYAFDGASSAPDFDTVMKGCLVHDFCYQFLNTKDFPITRAEADDLLKTYTTNAFLGFTYWAAVRTFGSIYRFFTRQLSGDDKSGDLEVDLRN